MCRGKDCGALPFNNEYLLTMAEQTIGSTKEPIGTGVGIVCAFMALLFAGLFVFSLLDLIGADKKLHAETFVFLTLPVAQFFGLVAWRAIFPIKGQTTLYSLKEYRFIGASYIGLGLVGSASSEPRAALVPSMFGLVFFVRALSFSGLLNRIGSRTRVTYEASFQKPIEVVWAAISDDSMFHLWRSGLLETIPLRPGEEVVVLDGQKVQLPSNGCERGWVEVWGAYDDDAYLVQVLQERCPTLLIAERSALGFYSKAMLTFQLETVTGGTLLRITEENIDKSLLGLFLGRLYA